LSSAPHLTSDYHPHSLTGLNLLQHTHSSLHSLEMDFVFNISAFFPLIPSAGAIEDPFENDGAPKDNGNNPYGFCVVA
jgi:hypothetical protein